jgi:hypothetical protein
VATQAAFLFDRRRSRPYLIRRHIERRFSMERIDADPGNPSVRRE